MNDVRIPLERTVKVNYDEIQCQYLQSHDMLMSAGVFVILAVKGRGEWDD